MVFGPALPSPPPSRVADCGVERQVIQPPALFAHELSQLCCAGRAPRPLPLEEPVKSSSHNARLQGAYGRVVDTAGRTRTLQRLFPFLPEGLLNRWRIEILDRSHVQVNRIHSEGGQGAVRARLTRGEFVRREDLEQLVPRPSNPRGGHRKVRDLADAPVSPRADRKERQNDARLSVHGGIEHL